MALVMARLGVDDLAAADGEAGRRDTQDKAVASGNGHRLGQLQLRPATLARLQFVAVQKQDARPYLFGAHIAINFTVMLQRARRAAQQLYARIQQRRWTQPPRQSDDIAARQIAFCHACQIHRGAPTWLSGLHTGFVHLEMANAGAQPLRQYLHLLADAEGAIQQGTGDDGAEALNSENAINRQARAPNILAART